MMREDRRLGPMEGGSRNQGFCRDKPKYEAEQQAFVFNADIETGNRRAGRGHSAHVVCTERSSPDAVPRNDTISHFLSTFLLFRLSRKRSQSKRGNSEYVVIKLGVSWFPRR
jgi:hypothetical protein